MIFILGMVGGAVLPAGKGHAEPAARATPLRYVTQNHGVAIEVPPGLTYCPLPRGWLGADHGTTLFLVAHPSCAGEPAPPYIAVYYGLNVAEYDRPDGTDGPPRTPGELLVRDCPHPAARLGLHLLGRPALVCTTAGPTGTVVTSGAVYDLDPAAPGQDAPNRELTVSLATTAGRLPHDLRVFRRLLAHVSLCNPGWVRRSPGRPACSRAATWW